MHSLTKQSKIKRHNLSDVIGVTTTARLINQCGRNVSSTLSSLGCQDLFWLWYPLSNVHVFLVRSRVSANPDSISKSPGLSSSQRMTDVCMFAHIRTESEIKMVSLQGKWEVDYVMLQDTAGAS